MTASDPARIGGLLLAAGGSSRFGSPKQLARFDGKTLLRRAAEAISGSGCSPVVAVFGPYFEDCQREVRDLDLHLVLNSKWQTGMSSSIKIGLTRLLELDPEIDAVLIMLMDQPRVTSAHLAALIERFVETRSQIIAAKYSGIAGVPALFSKSHFDGLFLLEADQGARVMIRKCAHALTIDLDDAAFDIDTLADAQDPGLGES